MGDLRIVKLCFMSTLHLGPDVPGIGIEDSLSIAHSDTVFSCLINAYFEHLIRNLLRRIRFLSYFHCGEDLDIDARALIAASTAVKHNSHLNWLRKDRYSYRAEKSVPMGGFIGKIRFSGELEPFLPFIYLGEYLHIGHHTAFGFGQYRINYDKS